MKCRIYKLWKQNFFSPWKAIFRRNFEKDHCQQKLWHIGPSSVFRLKKILKTSEGDKGKYDRVQEKNQTLSEGNILGRHFWRPWKMKGFLGLSQLRKKLEISRAGAKWKNHQQVFYAMKFDMLGWLLFLWNWQLLSSILYEIIRI